MMEFNADELNQMGGAFIRLTRTSVATDVTEFEVDIGYPSITDVFGFQISENNMYPILYDYAGSVEQNQTTREINNEGQVVNVFRNPLAIDPQLQRTTTSSSVWWTQMVRFPVRGTLSIRSLIRPAILTSSVRINQLFYGKNS
ncbi:MAG: hypothetical protein FWE03_05090 [Firmicutes bacterium]|nr:hypothetical protein [Bacillota bacterium]